MHNETNVGQLNLGTYFVNGAGKYNSSGQDRCNDAKINYFTKTHIKNLCDKYGIFDKNGTQIKKIYFICHSMGSAFGEGIISQMKSCGVDIELVFHFSAANNNDFEVTHFQKKHIK